MQAFDGVMLGRAAWHNPGILADISRALSPDRVLPEPAQIVHDMAAYAEGQVKRGVPLRIIVKPMLGWMSGRSGARYWRRTLSDADLLNRNDPRLLERAWSDLVSRTSDDAYELAASSESLGQSRI
jgi:tRNA-dihydrouridine synthase A